jgi:hypothetical protein
MSHICEKHYFDEPKQQTCLEVRRRNCGVNGQVVLFYARRQATPIKPKKATPAPSVWLLPTSPSTPSGGPRRTKN